MGIINPVNKLFSLAYKVQQTFFLPAKKNLNLVMNMIHASCLRVVIVMETYLFVSKVA